MIDLLRHPRLPGLARAGLVVSLAAFTYTAFAQYRQAGSPALELQDFAAGLAEYADTAEAVTQQAVSSGLPDFESYDSTDSRKEAFFAYLTSYVEAENRRIQDTRSVLQPMWEVARRGHSLSMIERASLLEIAEEYRLDATQMDDHQLLDELMKRVDVIPTSLVLAQAANESAWGMSRFAREANNIFGQWCFDAGCGLVPARRHSSATHEVRAFDSVQASVNAYFRNLNTNQSYEDMRAMRAQMRAQGRSLDSIVLARGLTRYSERGMAYVTELQDIIRINRLSALDRS